MPAASVEAKRNFLSILNFVQRAGGTLLDKQPMDRWLAPLPP